MPGIHWEGSSPTPRAVPSIARTPPSDETATDTDCSTLAAVSAGTGGVQPASAAATTAIAAPAVVLRAFERILTTSRRDGAPVAPLMST
ncbi:hypothetical protein C5C24_03615 [Rathayibacter sp. AY2B3]|nr:hypothetical protein C5C24_03615 [Rathayibacter sp. AY2B3]